MIIREKRNLTVFTGLGDIKSCRNTPGINSFKLENKQMLKVINNMLEYQYKGKSKPLQILPFWNKLQPDLRGSCFYK